MPRVLIVEDDESMAVALRDGFGFEGFEVEVANDGQQALHRASAGQWDLVVLDVMLPKLSGLDVCRELRRGGSTVPILMLTARGQEIDKVVGLRTGADDYLTKPFGFLELMARVEALLRRAKGAHPSAERYAFGEVSLDFARMEATRSGQPVELSRREFELLRYMIDHRGRVLTRERILDAVWGYDEESLTRTVDMHVAKLRKKLEAKPERPVFIVTVHGVGYRFDG